MPRRRASICRVRRALAVLLALSALVSTGCSSSTDRSAPAKDGAFNPQAPLDSFPGAQPQETVLGLWRLIQIGMLPVLPAGYDQRVIDAVGSEDIIDTLALQRTNVAALRPKVVSVKTVAGGHTLVIVDARDAKGKGGQYAFLLGREGDRWRIRYDSLLGESLGPTKQAKVKAESRLPPARAEREAARAASEVTRRFRTLFGPPPRLPVSQRERRADRAQPAPTPRG